jgi:hypothetical protein
MRPQPGTGGLRITGAGIDSRATPIRSGSGDIQRIIISGKMLA